MAIEKNSGLNTSNFFHYYFKNPRADELSSADKTKALIFTVLLGFSFGIGHLICNLIYSDKYKITKNENSESSQKSSSVAQGVGITRQGGSSKLGAQSNSSATRDNPSSKMGDIPSNKKGSAPSGKTGDKPGGNPLSRNSDKRTTSRDVLSNFFDKQATSRSDLPPLPKILKPDSLNQESLLFYSEYRSSGKRDKADLPIHRLEEKMQELADCPLGKIDEPGKSQLANPKSTKDEKPFNEFRGKLKERLQLLDEAVDLRQRLEGVNNRSLASNIQVQDIEAPWEKSALRIVLMDEDQFKGLSLDTIIDMDKRRLQILKERAAELPKSEVDVKEIPFEKLTLQQFLNLPASSEHLKHLHGVSPNILSIFPEHLIPELDLSQFDKSELNIIFDFSPIGSDPTPWRKMSLLNVEQLYAAQDRFDPQLFALISEKQLQNWDFGQVKMNEKLFKKVFDVPERRNFGTRSGGNGAERISNLSSEQIQDCWDMFTPDQMAYITKEQAEKLDYKILAKKDGRKLKDLFYCSSQNIDLNDQGKAKLRALKQPQLYECFPYLTGSELKAISSPQLRDWEFDKYPFTKEIFDDVFQARMLSDTDYDSISQSRIKELTAVQIAACWVLMEGKHTVSLTPEQLRRLDFKDLIVFGQDVGENINRIQGLFYLGSSIEIRDLAREKMKAIEQNNLVRFYYLLTPEQYVLFSDDQLKEWDFETNPLSKDAFSRLFSARDSVKDIDDFNLIESNRIRLLSAKQIQDSWELITEVQAASISAEQASDLNLENLSLSGVEAFKGLFFKFEHNLDLFDKNNAKREILQEKLRILSLKNRERYLVITRISSQI